MSERLVTIARFTQSSQADMARQLLEDFGIKAVVVGRYAADAYCGIPTVACVELQTLESQARRAIEILKKEQEKQDGAE